LRGAQSVDSGIALRRYDQCQPANGERKSVGESFGGRARAAIKTGEVAARTRPGLPGMHRVTVDRFDAILEESSGLLVGREREKIELGTKKTLVNRAVSRRARKSFIRIFAWQGDWDLPSPYCGGGQEKRR
jgi:hypothetical protein